jgi:hypothetical protein
MCGLSSHINLNTSFSPVAFRFGLMDVRFSGTFAFLGFGSDFGHGRHGLGV